MDQSKMKYEWLEVGMIMVDVGFTETHRIVCFCLSLKLLRKERAEKAVTIHWPVRGTVLVTLHST